jgi:UDP-2-acetamido-2-deoxy-ribo-hexuluronate aminotransferase
MQFIDLKAIHAHSASAIDAAVAKVFEHGRYINGPEVYELEATLGEFLGTPNKPLHCVAVAPWHCKSPSAL